MDHRAARSPQKTFFYPQLTENNRKFFGASCLKIAFAAIRTSCADGHLPSMSPAAERRTELIPNKYSAESRKGKSRKKNFLLTPSYANGVSAFCPRLLRRHYPGKVFAAIIRNPE